MPITGVGSYPPTMQEFINHWTQVNIALGASPLTLRGGYALANFTADRTAIITAINAVITQDNLAQTAAGNLFNSKTALRNRLIQFRKWVGGYLPGSGYANALPVAPPFAASESKFLDPFQDALTLWTTINADATLTGVPLPLTLSGPYVLATFTADLTALRTAYITGKNADEQATLLRKQRDVLLRPAELRMKQYREVIPARFDPTSPFVASLPALTPPPGSTPEPVEVNAAWNVALNKAVLNWTPSAAPNLAHYSVRACTGTVYKVSNEFAVLDLPPGTLTLATLAGLPVPGAKAVYRVYVVLTTGNERGSNNAPVVRV
jgi:hypothetical protein